MTEKQINKQIRISEKYLINTRIYIETIISIKQWNLKHRLFGNDKRLQGMLDLIDLLLAEKDDLEMWG